MHPRKAFTLIELLIVIAIIAILSIVVVLTLNPAQLLMQGRDSNRVSDLATINTALGVYSAQGGTSFGSSNVVYVSIPDPTATSSLGDQCQGLGLISLPSTYTYHCAASSTYRLTNGTGWIPVNFASLPGGSPLGSLPIDPLNTSSTRNYYAYTTNGSQYEMTAPMESQKYQLGGSNDVISGDGGTLATVYEKGTTFGLEPLDYGDTSLVGDWSLDEGTGTVAYDYSGNNAAGSWTGTQTGSSGYYSAGKIGPWAGAFDGSTDYISATAGPAAPTVETVSFWLNVSSTNPSTVPINVGTFNYYINATSCAGINQGGTVYGGSFPYSNQWVLVTMVLYNGNYVTNGSALYYNGVPQSLTVCLGGSGSATLSNSVIMGVFIKEAISFPDLLTTSASTTAPSPQDRSPRCIQAGSNFLFDFCYKIRLN